MRLCVSRFLRILHFVDSDLRSRRHKGQPLQTYCASSSFSANAMTLTPFIISYSCSLKVGDNTPWRSALLTFSMTLTVLQVPFGSHYWYQKALLFSELEDIFAKAPLAPNDVTNPRVRDAYARATGRVSASGIQNDNSKKKAIEEGTECSICYEDMQRVDERLLVFCETSCGNALHKECFGQCTYPLLDWSTYLFLICILQGRRRRVQTLPAHTAELNGPLLPHLVVPQVYRRAVSWRIGTSTLQL